MATATKPAKMDRPKPPAQLASELKAMAEFYGNQYERVYFVRCLLNKHIIAVEVSPAKEGAAIVERADGPRNIFGYQEQFFTTRYRMDVAPNGQRMVGYECRCGNDTRMGVHERGAVQQRHIVVDKQTGDVVKADPPLRVLSPFERAQVMAQVRIQQAKSKQVADYKTYVDAEGHYVERFESFEIVRMK